METIVKGETQLEGTKGEGHDDVADKLKGTRGGAYTTQTGKKVPTVLPPTPKCTSAEDKTRDEYALKKVEMNEPLELVLLDPN